MKPFYNSFVNYGLYIISFACAIFSAIVMINENTAASIWSLTTAGWIVSSFFSNQRANMLLSTLKMVGKYLAKENSNISKE